MIMTRRLRARYDPPFTDRDTTSNRGPADMATAAPQIAAEEPILLREDTPQGIVRLTLNRPRQRNPLSTALMARLKTELEAIADSRDVRVVVLAANGPAFSAGHDLKEVRGTPTAAFYKALFDQCSELMLAITHLPQPVIAEVQGVASAAGCQLVATCDLAVASEDARFATPGVNIGLFCSTPMVALSRVVSTKQAMEMLLTGDMVDAVAAQAMGLVNRVVAAQDLTGATMTLARQIASKSRLTVSIGKEAFYRQREFDLAEAYAYTSQVMTRNMQARDAEEGIDAFIQKRDPVWEDR